MKKNLVFLALLCTLFFFGISSFSANRELCVNAAEQQMVWVDPGLEIPPCPGTVLENPPCPTSNEQKKSDADNGAFIYVEEGLTIPPCPATWDNPTNTSTPVLPASNNQEFVTGVSYYEVLPQSGDGWYKLAVRYGVDVDQLMALNGGSLTKGPRIGQLIKIPTSSSEGLWNLNPNTEEIKEEFLTSATLKNIPGTPSWTNATHAADLLNGMVVKSNEIFSWWGYSKFPNHCMKADGFVKAPVYPEGTAYGGGICFTSTVLYQGAVLKGNMQKVERHSHSKPVIYARSGEDASVTWSAWDNRFKNPFDYDVKFYFTYNAKGEMTVSLYKIS